MPDIKTRQKVHDVKALDKAALAGERMKNATIRTKAKAEESVHAEGQGNPSDYAEEQINSAVAVTATEVGHAGKKGAQKIGEMRKERQAAAPESPSVLREPAQNSDRPHSQQTPQPRQQHPVEQKVSTREALAIRTKSTAEAKSRAEQTTVKTPDPVERGREYAKQQTRKRTEEHRKQEIRQISRPVHNSQTAQPVGEVKSALPRIRQQSAQAVKTRQVSRGTKNAQRTVKSAGRSVKTAQQTSKTAIKTAKATEKAAQKTAQASAKAARATAQAAKAAAREAVVVAKVVGKAIVSMVKAIIAALQELVASIAAGGWVAVVVIVMICLIGLIVGSCFGIFFSGEDSGTGQTMPMVVREINQEYEERLEQIKADNPHDILETSGSRAVWPEVLSIYAVKTTTDPDNAQDVASMDDGKKQLLKEIFWEMNDISYRTETHTVTEITETADEDGNIIEEETEVEKTTLYIVVSHKTAAEMAAAYSFNDDQNLQLSELLSEENRSLWSSVLYGIGTGDDAIVVVALSQLGNVGGHPYWSWYGFAGRVEWCACFVSWCADQCGYLDAGVIPKFAGCEGGSQWFKNRGLWQDRNYEPRPGDIIFFDWRDPETGLQDGSPDHVGIVEKVEGNTIYTVEGNSGNACRENTYSIGYFEIYGYGTPAY